MSKLLVSNARMVSECRLTEGDRLVVDGRIDQIGAGISAPEVTCRRVEPALQYCPTVLCVPFFCRPRQYR